MAVTDFDLSEARNSNPGDRIEFSSHEIVVSGIDAISGSRRCGRSSASYAIRPVKAVVRIGEPKSVPFQRQAHARMRFELIDRADIVNVLQGNEIHVAIELVVAGIQVIERLMLTVVWIAVA